MVHHTVGLKEFPVVLHYPSHQPPDCLVVLHFLPHLGTVAQCKLLCNESRLPQKMQEKNMTKTVGSNIMLLQIDTLRHQQKELEHKGGQR